MWDYQNEPGRVSVQRPTRGTKESETHPGKATRQPIRGNSNAPAITVQNDPSSVQALHRHRTEGSISRRNLSRSWLLQLQHTHGNQYISRLLQAAEPKNGESDITENVERTIERTRGGGQALDSAVKTNMGRALEADFNGVRVHTDAEADGLNRSLQARAFTTGKDVYFRHGEYSPGSSSGRELLAHELTHVVQQGGALQTKNDNENNESGCSACAAKSTVATLQTKLTLGAPNDIYEQEADRIASAYSDWERQPATKDKAGSQVRRQESEEENKEQLMQTKLDPSHLLRQPEEEKEEEPVQARSEANAVQRQMEEKEEESMQAKYETGVVRRQSEESD